MALDYRYFSADPILKRIHEQMDKRRYGSFRITERVGSILTVFCIDADRVQCVSFPIHKKDRKSTSNRLKDLGFKEMT